MSAERGWIADPPPPPPRDAVPGEERKWHIMVGATSKGGYRSKEAREAHKQYQETGTWQARQHVDG